MIVPINKKNKPKRKQKLHETPKQRFYKFLTAETLNKKKHYCGTFKKVNFFCSQANLFKKVHKNVKMNLKVCKKNLIILQDMMNFFNIPFYLVFGTLLGAIREGNFIKHDKDTDIAILNKSIKNLCTLLKSEMFFRSKFEVCRAGGDLISITRDGEYIDIYTFYNIKNRYRCQVGVVSDPLRSFDNPSTISFLGKKFQTVQNPKEYFLLHYGKNWRTPKKGAHAR